MYKFGNHLILTEQCFRSKSQMQKGFTSPNSTHLLTLHHLIALSITYISNSNNNV